MKVFRRVGKVFKPFVNFPQWMGWKTLVKDGKIIKDSAESLYRTQKAKHNETFEEALTRLELSESDLKNRSKKFCFMAKLYLGIAIAIFLYAIYLLIAGSPIMAAVISFILVMVALAFAYREHFWYFQMKQRRLGCTLKQYLTFLLKKGGKQ